MRTTADSAGPGDTKTYGVILFDFDGTIADTVPLIMESFQHVFRTVTGSSADERFLLSTIGEPLERTFRFLDEGRKAEALRLYFEYNEKALASGVGVFLGIPAMLARIRAAGARTAIVTSKRLSVTQFTLRQFGLDPLFDVTVTRESTARHKPFPDPVDKALEVIGERFSPGEEVDRQDALFIGDSLHDLLCARNAGVDIAIVDWTYMDKDELRRNRPDHWVYHADDIAGLCRPFVPRRKERS